MHIHVSGVIAALLLLGDFVLSVRTVIDDDLDALTLADNKPFRAKKGGSEVKINQEDSQSLSKSEFAFVEKRSGINWKRYKPFKWMGNKENLEGSLTLAANRLKKLERANIFKLQDGEHVLFAYKRGRYDALFFTNLRLLDVDGHWLSSRVAITSYFYVSVLAFAFETAGFFDWDSEISIYTSVAGRPFFKFELHSKVNIFRIQKFISARILGKSGPPALVQTNPVVLVEKSPPTLVETMASANTSIPNMVAFLTGDAVEQDPKFYEELFRSEETPILRDDEVIEAAFKNVRDSMVFTSKRIILVDVRGLTGTRYKSIPYTSIGAYLVETAGGTFSFDKDSEVKIWTTIPYGPMVSFEKEIRKGMGDILQVQYILSKYVLGSAGDSPKGSRETAVFSNGGISGFGSISIGFGSILSKFGDDAAQINPQEAEQYLQRSARILIDDERVQLAFRVGRDMTLMTSSRIIFVDVQGIGDKVEYKSVPYSHIVAYAIESAGFADLDSELKIWTDVPPDPKMPQEPPCKKCPEGNGPCPCVYEYPWAPRNSGMAYFEQDLLHGYADVFAVQGLLSEKVTGGKQVSSLIQASESRSERSFQDDRGVWDVFAWLGSDMKQVSAKETEHTLKTKHPVLLEDEKVELPFRVGNDFAVLTSARILFVTSKSLISRKVEYRSIPYKHIRAYSVESAGTFDLDSEMEFHTTATWPVSGGKAFPCSKEMKCASLAKDIRYVQELKISQDLQKGRADLSAVQKLVSEKVFGVQVMSSFLQTDGPFAWLASLVSSAHRGTDVVEAEAELIQEIGQPFVEGEELKKAYKVGRDWLYFTNKRLIVKDVQGLTGAKTEYKNIPYQAIRGVTMQTAGKLDADAELWVETDSWSVGEVQKKFFKWGVNVREVYDLISKEHS